MIDNSLRVLIELDSKVSGRFELDDDGWTRFYPTEEKERELNAWISAELESAITAHEPLFREAAQNRETYKPINITLDNDGGRSILPSPIARTPADNIIATTTNNVNGASPMFAVDAVFPEKYPVIVPVDADHIRERGLNLAPKIAPDGTATEVTGNVPVPLDVDAEVIAEQFEKSLEFKNRERIKYPQKMHVTIAECVTVGRSYQKVVAKRKCRTIISTRKNQAPFVDPYDEAEYTVEGEKVDILNVPFENIVRPNLDQCFDDLDWYGERDPKSPNQLTREYADGKLFLIKDDDDCKACASACTTEIPEPKRSTDAKVKKYDPQDTRPFCDVWEVPFYAYLRVKTEADAKAEIRKFSMVGVFHRAMRRFLAIHRNPYQHQRRIIVPFQQFLDGSCTVGIARHAQMLQTHLAQAELTTAFQATHPKRWYNPQAYDMATYITNHVGPWHSDEWIPGVEGVDWGFSRGGYETHSQLDFMQWNAGTNQEAASVSDYSQGARVVSHTSPQTVDTMLNRGDQNQILFLGFLNTGAVEVMKLYLETCRQFAPMGENIPIRDPEKKAITMVPFLFPIGEMMDNFRITLTAADDAARRERDPDERTNLLMLYQQRATFIAQVMEAMRAPNATEEDMALLRKMLAGDQKLFDRIISRTRADEKDFDIMAEVDAVIDAKRELMAQQPPPQPMGVMNGATGESPDATGAIPGGAPADAAGGVGSGEQPGVAMAPPGDADPGNVPPQ